MKPKILLFTILLTLALVSAACAGQETNNQPEQSTAMPTVATDVSTVTEEAGDAEMTPTGAAEAAESETPTEPAEGTDMTPTASAENGTPAGAGGTPGIPQTGPGDAGIPDDLDEMVRVLRTAGATVNLGEVVENELVSVPGQRVLINGEEVQVFTYETAEELESVASQLENSDPESEPQFYKLGNMLVRYAGTNTLVRDLLEDVLGAQAAGQ